MPSKKTTRTPYICANNHITYHWTEKKPPKHCAQWQAGKGCAATPKLEVVSEDNKSETAFIGGRPLQPKKKRVVKKKV